MTTEPRKSISVTACVLFLMFICSTLGNANVPHYSPITDVQAGTLDIISNQMGSVGYFEAAYPSPFEVAPNVALAIPSIEMNPGASYDYISWKVVLVQSYNPTHIIVKMAHDFSSFSSFKVSYIAISSFLDFLKVDYMEMNESMIYPLTIGSGLRYVDQVRDLSFAMDNLIIIPYIAGIKMSSPVSQLRFAMNASAINQFTMNWHVFCYGNTIVTEISAFFLIYGKTSGETSHPDIVPDYEPINITSNWKDPSYYLPFFQETNLLVGLTSFNFTNGFSFNIYPSTLLFASTIGNLMAENITFGFLSIKRRNCLTETPFYEKFTNMCYEVCPMGFYGMNLPIQQCAKCSIVLPHCAQCTSKYNCTICMPGYVINPASHSCVCAVGYYWYEHDKSCYSKCPAGLLGDEISGKCTMTCMDGTFSNYDTYTCSSACLAPLYGDPLTLMCIRECPTEFFGDSSIGKCVQTCSPGYFGDQATRKCSTQCSAGYYGFEQMRQCVTQCFGLFLSFEPTRMCITQCPDGYFADFMTHSCVKLCPENNYADLTSKKCVQLCPDFFFGDNITRTCVQECPSGSFGEKMARICLAQCPLAFFAEMNQKLCVAMCPIGYYGDFANRKCVAQCSAPLFASDQMFICVAQCPMGFYGDAMTSKCVNICPASSNTYGENSTKMCVSSCQTGTFAQNSTRLCVASCWGGTFGDSSTNRCVNMCPSTPPLYASQMQNKCVAVCMPLYFAQTIKRTCVMECPVPGLYRQNSTQMCVQNCFGEEISFADNATGFCAAKCSVGTWGESSNKKCVQVCPASFFGYNELALCVSTCPVPYFGDPLTKSCVASCPTLYSGNDQTRLCEGSCSAGTWSDMTTQQCVAECPAGSFRYAEIFACVTVCPLPYFGDPVANKCVEECPVGYYGYFLTRMCVVSTGCAPYFGVNDTRRCERGCPQDQWKNQNMSRCDACDSSCKTCVGSSTYNCTSCKSDTVYLSTVTMECLACVAPCLTCQSESTCLSCMDGNYFVPTNQCFACDIKCKTCARSATNCTSCAPNRALNSNSDCECISGLEDAQGNCASLCTDAGCESCPNDKNACTQCKNSLILINSECKCPNSTFLFTADNSCINCHPLCSSCTGPLENQCTECSSAQNRQLNKTTFTCDCKVPFYAPNNESTCIKEPLPECPAGFGRDPTGVYCDEICGDGKLYEFECDDGNSENFDGCDSNCKIETNFSCLNNNTEQPTICSYRGQIIFELLSALKEIYGNIIKLEYRMIPNLKFFEKFPDFKSTLKISQSFTRQKKTARQIPMTSSDSDTSTSFSILSALYSSNTKTLLVDVAYSETATGKTLKVSYTPEETPYSHAMEETSYEWPIKVSNGLSLIYYPDEIYSQAKTFNTVAMTIYTGTLCLFVLVLFFRKMIGIEMIILIQAQVLSLSMLKEIHPNLGVLTEEKYAFGYNQFHEMMSLKLKNTQQNIGLYKAINFSQVFGQNINIMFFVVCFFYLLAVILRLVALRKKNETGQTLKKAAMFLTRQIAFGFLLFSIMNLVTSYALQVYAGTIFSFSPEYSGALKITAIITIVASYVIYGLSFKESADSFVFYVRNSKLSQIQPLFIKTKAILIVIGIALHYSVGTPILYALIGLQGTYVVFLIVLKPFSNHLDLVRALILELSLLYIFVSRYILIGYINLEQPGEWKGFLDTGLFAEHAVIGLSLLISVISFIFHLFKANAQISPQQMIAENEIDVKKEKGLYESSLQIQDYLQDDFGGEDRKKGSSYDLTFAKTNVIELNNNSTTQLINLSEGEGYDSKRKLFDKGDLKTVQIIEMND